MVAHNARRTGTGVACALGARADVDCRAQCATYVARSQRAPWAHGAVWVVAHNARLTWRGRSVRLGRTGRYGWSRTMRDVQGAGATCVWRAGIKKPQPLGWGHSI
ncbi:hypothetical protein OS145_03552 [Idiomarina baltica OS145]|uniref:Uncharacterized protein n=1 Tax=Idiomarina baltica OS145 TaxID=314276 RepID=A0ABM9WIW5_9GAMM|nr:hypothetical protein OS145_03552 [Idiomarina baltica OS145]